MTERELKVAKVGAVVLGLFTLITLVMSFYAGDQWVAATEQGDEILWFALTLAFIVGFYRNFFGFLRYCKAIKNLDVTIIRRPKG